MTTSNEKTTIRRTVTLEPTPTEMGYLFAEMGSDEMAEFFNAVASRVNAIYPNGFGSLPIQLFALTQDITLRDPARRVMACLGEYAYNLED